MGQYLIQYHANIIYDIHSTWGNLALRLGQCLFHSWGKVEKNIGTIYIFRKRGNINNNLALRLGQRLSFLE